MAKKGKIADPHAAREAERYDNPIPSREAILALLGDADKPLNHNKIASTLGLEDVDADVDAPADQWSPRLFARNNQIKPSSRVLLTVLSESSIV